MKKLLLFCLSVLFTAFLVKAQDITSYRGAFAPYPEAQWTEGWTNWDPQNVNYPATTVNITTSITTNTTWTANNVYKISGIIYVNSGATLTIEPGTIIRGDHTVANSSLFITRGAKLIAIGTPCNPIIFTSNQVVGSRAKGDWGGVVLLGNAKNNQSTNVQIEGTSAGEPRNFHGGTDDNDNSGTMKYVRIEYGGYVFAPNNEINGLTFGSVGRGTTIDYVQVSFSNDDAYEWFGGTVNPRHLVSYRNLDDDWDTDFGFSGIVQYCLSIRDPQISDDPTVSTSEGFESDNDAAGDANTPKTAARFYNVTQIGAFRCNTTTMGVLTQPSAIGFRRGARIRRNSELKIFNSILMNDWRGLFIDGAATIATGGYAFQNNILTQDTTTIWSAPYTGVGKVGEDAFSASVVYGAVNNNTVISGANGCSLLTNVWGATNNDFPASPDFRPNPAYAGGNPASSGTTSGPNLSAVIEIDGALFTASQAKDFLVDVLENNTGATSGIITITIPKLSGWDITVPGLTLTGTNQSGTSGTSNVNGGTANINGNWNFRDDGANIIASSKPGITIAQNSFNAIGFTATRKAGTSAGTNQNMTATISGGNDSTPSNNAVVTVFSAN